MENAEINLLPIADGESKLSDLANCIRNNYRHLKKWGKRTCTDCFRIYDAQIHHYPLAIDYYAGRFCVHYYSKSIDEDMPPENLQNELEKALEIVFNVSVDSIYWRTRAKTKSTRQYEKLGESKEFFTVFEYGVKFKINLADYLDTGLFLDHRETRQLVAKKSNQKKLLNLFAYTCSFSVQAAGMGAIYTKSVDMSNTYTAWGKENFLLNGFDVSNHEIVRADCLKFLEEETNSGVSYDLVVIDPPTISRSKKMDQLFDIQYEYEFLIKKSLSLLVDNGQIIFSTNSRKFKFDETLFEGCVIKEITHKTIPLDFMHKKIHRCWEITKN